MQIVWFRYSSWFMLFLFGTKMGMPDTGAALSVRVPESDSTWN